MTTRREPIGLTRTAVALTFPLKSYPHSGSILFKNIGRGGLEFVSYGRIKPLFNPKSLWRIPPDINLTPVSLPARKITGTDVVALNERRAGNRGMANRRKTTPVFA